LGRANHKTIQKFKGNKKVAKEGGSIAGNTRKEIEEKTGVGVITDQNAKQIKLK